MEKKPFVHLFETPGNKYLYDVNTDKILIIDDCLYDFFQGKEMTEKELEMVEACIDMLKERGFLKNNRVEITEHPATEFIPFYINTRLHFLSLQLTQNCNLRCDYCVYSGKYNTRTHSNKRMDFEIAKEGIDYLIGHSLDSWGLTFGFYGGEPLLEIELMKKCVKYIEQQAEGRKISYVVTTNGTLFTPENIEFFVKYNFNVTVSLDGPKEIHDVNRRFAVSNVGSFDCIKKNLHFIKSQYPEFYKSNIRFNTVFSAKESLNCISDYFSGEELFKDAMFSSSIVSSEFAKEQLVIEEKFSEELRYEQFKLLLSKIGIVDEDDVSIVVKRNFDIMRSRFENRQNEIQKELPMKSHHGGPCIPGIQRLFLNAYGDFFPCEKVCETAEIAKIGDIKTGLDIKRVQKVLNVEKFTEDSCHNCWAYFLCYICIGSTTQEPEKLRSIIMDKCKIVRKSMEDQLKDYCALREWGYDFEFSPLVDTFKEIQEVTYE